MYLTWIILVDKTFQLQPSKWRHFHQQHLPWDWEPNLWEGSDLHLLPETNRLRPAHLHPNNAARLHAAVQLSGSEGRIVSAILLFLSVCAGGRSNCSHWASRCSGTFVPGNDVDLPWSFQYWANQVLLHDDSEDAEQDVVLCVGVGHVARVEPVAETALCSAPQPDTPSPVPRPLHGRGALWDHPPALPPAVHHHEQGRQGPLPPPVDRHLLLLPLTELPRAGVLQCEGENQDEQTENYPHLPPSIHLHHNLQADDCGPPHRLLQCLLLLLLNWLPPVLLVLRQALCCVQEDLRSIFQYQDIRHCLRLQLRGLQTFQQVLEDPHLLPLLLFPHSPLVCFPIPSGSECEFCWAGGCVAGHLPGQHCPRRHPGDPGVRPGVCGPV